MKPFITIEMPAGATYQIPSVAVLNNYIAYRVSEGSSPEAVANEAAERFEDDESAIDWLQNNMNWSDIAPFARMVAFNVPDIEAEFNGASFGSDDAAKPVIAFDGTDNIFAYPIEAILNNLTASQQIASTLIVDSQDEGVDFRLSLTVVQGPKKIVDGFIAVQKQFSDFLRDQANTAAAAADAAQGTNLPVTH